MMYDPIFSKSFSRNERRRFGLWGALLLCFIIGLSISSSFKPHLHPLSLIGEAVNVQLSINAVEDMLMNIDDSIREDSKRTDPTDVSNGDGNSQLPINNAAENILLVKETNRMTSQPAELEVEKKTIATNVVVAPITLCRILKADADYCEIGGDIRIQANSSTIFVVKPPQEITRSSLKSNNINKYSWSIQPYPRRGISHVKHWAVKLVEMSEKDEIIPKCDQNHSLPAILFSMGGYSGNHFHDFADLIFPLYSTSFHFQKDVHFLATDYKPWWIPKYKQILNQLTRHEIMDIDREKTQVHCYDKMVAGLKFQREFINDNIDDPSPSKKSSSMQHFRQLLRQAYSLERKNAVVVRTKNIRPRLMIVSRKRTRILKNEDEVSRMAKKLGFEVISAEAQLSTNLSRFAEIVNSCDVMMGIHGAGLTNMVFLPDKAVLIQVVPFGGIDAFARLDFGNPAPGMNIRYLEYKIGVKESSLSQQYGIDDPVIKDPMSFHRKGWGMIRSVYLDNQNVTIDVRRFKGTLARARRLLRH